MGTTSEIRATQANRPANTAAVTRKAIGRRAPRFGKTVGFGGSSLKKGRSNQPEPVNEPALDEVEVVQYNLLSSHLSQPSYFWHNDEEDLDPTTRLQRVKAKLKPMIERGAIVCLQECSRTWISAFHIYFQQCGYYFISSSYGWRFDGYMGVGIAFPMRRFNLTNVLVQRISEAKPWPNMDRKALPQNEEKAHYRSLLDFAGYFASPMLLEELLDPNEEGEKEEYVDEWSYSKQRKNEMVAVQLTPRTGVCKPFTVATYHMPCAYSFPKVMVIHTALAAQRAIKFANGHPLILAGDWNFKPGTAPYQLLTTGNLSEEHPAYPAYPDGENWRIETGLSELRSAYAERHPGGEPEFTNYAWVKDDPDPFAGTLDYIFVSEETEVLSVGRLPSITSITSPLPNREEPSDHLMLSARIRPYPSKRKDNSKKEKKKIGNSMHLRPRGFGSTIGRNAEGLGSSSGSREARGSRSSVPRRCGSGIVDTYSDHDQQLDIPRRIQIETARDCRSSSIPNNFREPRGHLCSFPITSPCSPCCGSASPFQGRAGFTSASRENDDLASLVTRNPHIVAVT